MEALKIAAFIAAGACAAGTAYWLVALFRILREIATLPRVRSGLALPEPKGGWPRVSVIVPAHNEEQLGPRCARSLLASEYPSLEVVFVLDRCTDGTLAALREIAAEDPRLVIVENDSCPADWAGKCNAARVGAERASGEMLLFTDADTHFEPGLVRASVALARQRGLGLLSILSTLSAHFWFERVVQPVAAMTLVQMYPVSSANRPENPRVFANGQFMLFERSTYEKLGGHAAVKDDLLEDIAFARAVRDRVGGRCGLFLADGMLLVHMYDSLAALVQGWKRIYIEACLRSPLRLRRKAMQVWMPGVALPIAQLLAILLAIIIGGADRPLAATLLALGAGGLLLQWFSVGLVYWHARTPIWAAILYPIGCLYVVRSMWSAAADLVARRPVRWGGREYILEPR